MQASFFFQLGALFLSCGSLSQSFMVSEQVINMTGFNLSHIISLCSFFIFFFWFYHSFVVRFSLFYGFIAPVTWFRVVHDTALSDYIATLHLWSSVVTFLSWFFGGFTSRCSVITILVPCDQILAIENAKCISLKFDWTNYALRNRENKWFVEGKGLMGLYRWIWRLEVSDFKIKDWQCQNNFLDIRISWCQYQSSYAWIPIPLRNMVLLRECIPTIQSCKKISW